MTSKTIFQWFALGFILISAVGLVDASYLTLRHFQGIIPTCAFLSGCEKVLASQYAVIANIPTALFGVFYYFSILVLVLLFLISGRLVFMLGAAAFSAIGFLATIWFLYLQVFVLKAFCFYCLISAFCAALLFAGGIAVLFLKKRHLASEAIKE